MATAEKLKDYYLTCIICSEDFTNPATLQCDHTFCRPCLLKYTKTQTEAIQAKSIPCPVCKQMTKVTSAGGTVDQWIDNLKPSRIIRGLIDDFGKCLEEDATEKKSQPFLCKTHEDEEIKMFCQDCRKAICHICCGTDHRHCKSIVPFKKILPRIRSSILTTKQRFTNMILMRNDLITKRNTKIKEIQDQSAKTAIEIQTVTNRAMDVIRAKEEKLMGKLEEIKTNQVQQLKDELNFDELTVRGYQQQLHFIEKAVKSDCQEDIYDVYNTCKTEPTDDIIDVSSPDKITFRLEEGCLSTFEDIQIGEVYSMKAGDIGRETFPFLQQNIDTRTTKDKLTPDITDVTVVEKNDDKLLVVVDRKNKSIKSFHTDENQQLVDVLKLDSDPFGITAISKDEVLVTIPITKEAKKISVFPKLTYLTTLSTGRSHFGIHYRGGSTLLACRCPVFGKSTVDMMDMKGKVFKSFELGTLTCPKFVLEDNAGTVIASEDNRNEIIFISLEQHIPTKTIDASSLRVGDPRGIKATVTGDLLVAGSSTNNVIQMTQEGEFVRELLTSADGLDKPHGICMDKDGMVYVTCGQYVKMFVFH